MHSASETLRHAGYAPEVDDHQSDPHQQQHRHKWNMPVNYKLGRDEASGFDQRIGALLEQLVDEVLIAIGAREYPHRRTAGKEIQRNLHQREQHRQQRDFYGHDLRIQSLTSGAL